MLLIILALFWVVLLTPIAVRRFRDNGTEKSIESFHAEHEVLSRQEYVYAPAHRLDEPDERDARALPGSRRARLTIVHDDDTYQSLETRGTWDEWRDSYDFDHQDDVGRASESSNRYASAYSATPRTSAVREYRERPIARRTMRAQRRMILTRLLLSVATITVLGFVTGYSLVVDVAVVTWLAFALYVALALYAVSQGYLFESSIGIRFSRERQLASVAPLYGQYGSDDPLDAQSEFYDPNSDVQWRRESPSRYAVG